MSAKSSGNVNMSNNLLSYAGWTFLPNVRTLSMRLLLHLRFLNQILIRSIQLVTGWVQSLYYGITIRAGDPKPQQGTPRYIKHRKRIHIAVIVIYLLYTIYEADYWIRQEGDFYQYLGVPLDVDEKKVKSRFRRLYVVRVAFQCYILLTCPIAEPPYIIQTKLFPPKTMPMLKHSS